MKEEITNLFYFPKPVDIRDNVIEFGDSETLIEYKKEYPFKLFNSLTFCIQTTKRNFSLFIRQNFVWNGADIPPFLWFIGTRTSNEFLLASLIHDFMLNEKYRIINEILYGKISLQEYRRLTSLIFREVLINTGTGRIKANIMSFSVDCWQKYVFWKAKRKKKNGQ